MLVNGTCLSTRGVQRRSIRLKQCLQLFTSLSSSNILSKFYNEHPCKVTSWNIYILVRLKKNLLCQKTTPCLFEVKM